MNHAPINSTQIRAFQSAIFAVTTLEATFLLAACGRGKGGGFFFGGQQCQTRSARGRRESNRRHFQWGRPMFTVTMILRLPQVWLPKSSIVHRRMCRD